MGRRRLGPARDAPLNLAHLAPSHFYAAEKERRIMMTVKFEANDKGTPVGKLADCELHFNDGPFAGLKLVGFAVWERKAGGGRNVTVPARAYSVGGERRSFALLRPMADAAAMDRLRDVILAAFAEFEAAAAAAQV